jgi:hypothetical protein
VKWYYQSWFDHLNEKSIDSVVSDIEENKRILFDYNKAPTKYSYEIFQKELDKKNTPSK